MNKRIEQTAKKGLENLALLLKERDDLHLLILDDGIGWSITDVPRPDNLEGDAYCAWWQKHGVVSYDDYDFPNPIESSFRNVNLITAMVEALNIKVRPY